MLTETEKILMQRLLDLEEGVIGQRKGWANVVTSYIATLNMVDNATNGQLMKNHPVLDEMREAMKDLVRNMRESKT